MRTSTGSDQPDRAIKTSITLQSMPLVYLLPLLIGCTADAPLIMVSETGRGRLLLQNGFTNEMVSDLGDAVTEHCVSWEYDPDRRCLIFEADYTEDGFLTAFSYSNGDEPGAPGVVAQFSADYNPELAWWIDSLNWQDTESASNCSATGDKGAGCRLNMPHAARWSVDGQHLIVADTLNSRILWLEPPFEEGVAKVSMELAVGHPDWDRYLYPNGIQTWVDHGRTWLLTTFKSGDHDDIAPRNTGRIVLWDITNPNQIRKQWAYPEDGYLAAVHNAMVVSVPSGQYLLYAHSFGAADSYTEGHNGSVGIAALPDVSDAPRYIGDGLLPGGRDELGFVREVEPTTDGSRLLITDSGCENPDGDCDRAGRVWEVAFPHEWPVEVSGAFSPDHAQQRFFFLSTYGIAINTELFYPYEVDPIDDGLPI